MSRLAPASASSEKLAQRLGYHPFWQREASSFRLGLYVGLPNARSLLHVLPDLIPLGGEQVLIHLEAPAELSLAEPIPLLQEQHLSLARLGVIGLPQAPHVAPTFRYLAEQVLGTPLEFVLSEAEWLLPEDLSPQWHPEHPEVLLHPSLHHLEAEPATAAAPSAVYRTQLQYLLGERDARTATDLGRRYFELLEAGHDSCQRVTDWEDFMAGILIPELLQYLRETQVDEDRRVRHAEDALFQELRVFFLARRAELQGGLWEETEPLRWALKPWLPPGLRTASARMLWVWAVASHPQVERVWVPWASLPQAVEALGLMRHAPLAPEFWTSSA